VGITRSRARLVNLLMNRRFARAVDVAAVLAREAVALPTFQLSA
jgi:hypothetical protein